MTRTLRHRGPDADGGWVDSEAGIALGHKRLAILELSERGAQPMHSACGRYVITFNGEIYNHLSLRQELEESEAINWRGASDTETLLAGFAAWGVKRTLEKTVGMFALGLWDRAERCLTLARDRFGEKPLYYGWAGHGVQSAFIFGSELKALRAFPGFDNAINRGAIALFLRFCYVPTPYSIYENIFKLEPGVMLTLDPASLLRRESRSENYWSYEDAAIAGLTNPVRSEQEGIERLEHALREAVRLQLMADVPVGAFLSGGIDSSTVVALMQSQSPRPVKTFTVGFDEAGFDESPHGAAVARHLGCDHHEVRVTPSEAQAVVPKLPTTYDEPFADSSQIPTSIICMVARQSVTVALSGDAGDELLGGYNRYFLGPTFWRLASNLPLGLRKAIGAGILGVPVEQWNRLGSLPLVHRRVALFGDKAHKLARRLETVRSVDDLYRGMVSEWRPEEVPTLAAGRLPTKLDTLRIEDKISEAEHRMMLLDGLTYLPDDILTKVDRAAMAVSLETRVPLLDHRVAEVAWRLPLCMKIRNGQGKWALRKILYRFVPAELVERPKAGFGIPIGQWVRGPLRDWAEALLAEERLRGEGFLDAPRVRGLWRDHLDGKRDWTSRLWNVLMFQAWLEEHRTCRRLDDARGDFDESQS
jgi:asparagine synthase (glutamine-hydrolysing)